LCVSVVDTKSGGLYHLSGIECRLVGVNVAVI